MIRLTGLLALAALVTVAFSYDDKYGKSLLVPDVPCPDCDKKEERVTFKGIVDLDFGGKTTPRTPDPADAIGYGNPASRFGKIKKGALEKVAELRALLEGQQTSQESAEAILKMTHAKNTLVFGEGNLLYVGIAEFLENYWETVNDVRFVTVNHSLNLRDDYVKEDLSFYKIRDGKSTAHKAERYWKEVDGVYKIVAAFYEKLNKVIF